MVKNAVEGKSCGLNWGMILFANGYTIMDLYTSSFYSYSIIFG